MGDDRKRVPLSLEEEIARTQLPSGDESFGIVEQRLGYSKMYVRCLDNKVRIGRIPGKYARRLWVRENDLVLLKPWPVQADKKCDLIYRYSRTQWDWLVKKGRVPADFR
ncbi:MAG: translation initiation factor eIF-1A [archaeon]